MPSTTGIADTQLPNMATAWMAVVGVLLVFMAVAVVSASTGDTSGAVAGGSAPVALGREVSPLTTTTSLPDGVCLVTVAGGRTGLRMAPTPLSAEIMSVPHGEYAVAESHTALSDSHYRWLRIDVGGTAGWIRDVAFDVETKSAECA